MSEKLIQIIMIAVTALMAVGTFWLGWETRGLKKSDIDSNIYISDVKMQIIGNQGNVIKDRSWQDGELNNTNAAYNVNTENKLLSLKFKNTGKTAGYIRLKNPTDIKNQTKSYMTENYSDNSLLVPALNESGWIYTFDIKNAEYNQQNDMVKFIKIDYIFELLDIKNNKYDEINLSVRCMEMIVPAGGTQILCQPIN